jgi:2-polyprenyl-3-methyl-5-hydroxy-6-metoxy-1,4-benzoquinol methylase
VVQWSSTYDDWSTKRINKLVSILGYQWFAGKRILDVGCGHGNNGKSFVKLGASCKFTDGREQHVNALKEEGATVEFMDQDKPWTIVDEHFDLIIHWGVLYHLDNWKQDLACATAISSLISLESVVANSDDSDRDEKIQEIGSSLNDHALNQVATTMSATNVEQHLTSLGWSHIRYDHSDLNSSPHHYDWTVTNAGNVHGQRRFWLCGKGLDWAQQFREGHDNK